MKYYYVVKNRAEDNLSIFDTFEEAITWIEKRSALLVEAYRIQLIPRR